MDEDTVYPLVFRQQDTARPTTGIMSLPLMILAAWIVTAESYSERSLVYAYTYMSKPPADKPAFYAERLLNGRVFASYNSWTNTSRPEVEWVKKHTSMWTRNTTRSDKHSWCKHNMDTMIARLNLSTSDNHVLGWFHGCRATRDGLSRLVFVGAVDLITFNGEPLVNLNRNMQFEGLDRGGVGAVIAAKWNALMPQKYLDYYGTSCMDSLREIEAVEAAYVRL